MSNPTPTHAGIIANAMDKRLARVRVALPGRVEAYDSSSGAVEVQPLIQDGEPDPDNNGERATRRLPKLLGVPVMFPGSGSYRITWPVNVGDTVLLVFSSSSLEYWLAVGGEVDPADDRRHDISDAVAIPGLFDFAHIPTLTPTNAMVVHAGNLLLGGPTATQTLFRGEAFMTAFHTLITAIGVAAATPTSATAGINTALAAFETAAPTFKTTGIKVT